MGLTIAIDGIFMISSQPGGYRTYTTHLVQGLQVVDTVNAYCLLLDRRPTFRLNANWHVDVLPRYGSLGFIWREQVSLSRRRVLRSADVLHAPGATAPLRIATPMVVTIYDDIEFTDPLPPIRQTKRWAMRVYSRIVQAQAAKAASWIITISEYSKQRIIRRFDIPADRVVVTHLAPSPHYGPGDRDAAEEVVCRKLGIRNYVLGLASAASRKNTSGLLAAYASLPIAVRREHPLLLVCTHIAAKSDLQMRVHNLGLENQVLLADDVADTDLALLYRAAGVFVFPSLEEGFGLPPLEAMASGAPVIASNTSAMPEVLGDAALLVQPTDVAALTTALHVMLENRELQTYYRQAGLEHSRRFSWAATAQQTLAVYALAAGVHVDLAGIVPQSKSSRR
jgi:glycosyltransferase involved in cell wall biosynthesis